MVTVMPVEWVSLELFQRALKREWETEDQRRNGNHTDHSIKNRLNTEESPGYMKKLAFKLNEKLM